MDHHVSSIEIPSPRLFVADPDSKLNYSCRSDGTTPNRNGDDDDDDNIEAMMELARRQVNDGNESNQQQQQSFEPSRIKRYFIWLQTIDGIVAVSYLCNIIARALPVLLVPIAAEERVIDAYDYNSDTDEDASTVMAKLIASQVAHITSMAFTGGAIGKFINGFICQQLGSYVCSKWYLLGMSICSLLFSFSKNAQAMGAAYAGMEFFSSIQYGSLAVMLANYYEHDHIQLAYALTALGLSSTMGEVLAKVAGTFLAGYHHWRMVMKMAATIALIGATIISAAPGREQADQIRLAMPAGSGYRAVTSAVRNVMGSKKFWILSFAYSMVFACGCVDRILVSFYYEVTNLPHNVCGGLTLSITFGLVHGLITGSEAYATMDSLAQKKSFLRKRYIMNVVSVLGLAVLSYYGPIYIADDPTAIRRSFIVASGVVLLSAAMASSIAFQFFQIPTMIAQKYSDNKAVCMSWMDGIGFMVSIPTFRALGVLVVPLYGWPAGWAMLAVLFALGGAIMLYSIGPILDASKFYADDDQIGRHPWRFFDWAMNVYATVAPDSVAMCYRGNFMSERYMPDSAKNGQELFAPEEKAQFNGKV